MIRGILLLSILALLACGAYLYHQVRFASASGPEVAPAEAPGNSKEIVFELGGAPPWENVKVDTVKGDSMTPAPSPKQVPPPAAPPAVAPPAAAPPAGSEPEVKAKQQDFTPVVNNDGEPVKEPAKGPPAPPLPAGATSVKIGKGETLYSIAVKFYGSGAPPVRKDIAAASRIGDETKIREGTVLALPTTAGGKKRK